MNSDTELLALFVQCFAQFDDCEVITVPTDASLLRDLESGLPGRFPRLFEQLLTSYRWSEVDLGRLRLLPNPPGTGFDRFATELFADRGLVEVLLRQGFIPFARAVDCAMYDPICFDTKRQRHGGDCPVVRLSHEAALIRFRTKQVAELAPTFRDLISLIIADARARDSHFA